MAMRSSYPRAGSTVGRMPTRTCRECDQEEYGLPLNTRNGVIDGPAPVRISAAEQWTCKLAEFACAVAHGSAASAD
jgi:hypothetical protein